MSDINHISTAKRVILEGSNSLTELAKQIPADFNRIVDYIVNLKGRVILTGIGKSGYIARKIAASMASTGTLAFYIHPAEASHGDLGMICKDDFVIMLSNNGETRELHDIIKYCQNFSIKITVMTMQVKSNLALNSDFLLPIPVIRESSLISAPTTSTLMMLSLGDALTVAIQEAKEFSKDDFSIYHPGGKIGSNLLKVKDIMHKNEDLPIVYENTPFSDTIITMNIKRLGCAVVVDDDLKLIGIVTDGDLRRHVQSEVRVKYAKDVMTPDPVRASSNYYATEALLLMNHHLITNLPITDGSKVVGLIHIHDLVKSGVS